jgi:hypothetical protein
MSQTPQTLFQGLRKIVLWNSRNSREPKNLEHDLPDGLRDGLPPFKTLSHEWVARLEELCVAMVDNIFEGNQRLGNGKVFLQISSEGIGSLDRLWRWLSLPDHWLAGLLRRAREEAAHTPTRFCRSLDARYGRIICAGGRVENLSYMRVLSDFDRECELELLVFDSARHCKPLSSRRGIKAPTVQILGQSSFQTRACSLGSPRSVCHC